MVDFAQLTIVFTWSIQSRLLVIKTPRYLSEVVMVMLSVGVGLAPSIFPPVRSNWQVFVKVMSSVLDRLASRPLFRSQQMTSQNLAMAESITACLVAEVAKIALSSTYRVRLWCR